MPDDHDYEALGRLLAEPESWTPDERSQVEGLLRQQRQMVEDAHPKDAAAQRRLRSVVEELEAALARADGADA